MAASVVIAEYSVSSYHINYRTSQKIVMIFRQNSYFHLHQVCYINYGRKLTKYIVSKMRGERRERIFGREERGERNTEERENKNRENSSRNGNNFQLQHHQRHSKHHQSQTKLHQDEIKRQERATLEKEATVKFILAYADLVDAHTMQGVIYNQDRAISLALIQIHEGTLRNFKQGQKSTSGQEESGRNDSGIKNKDGTVQQLPFSQQNKGNTQETYAGIVRKLGTQVKTGLVTQKHQKSSQG